MRMRFALFFILTICPTLTLADAPPVHIPADGWSLVCEHNGIVVQERSVPGYPMKAYRARGTLSAPIEQILEVLSDTDTASDWMPELDRQQVVSAVSDVEMITLNIYGVPFPFADRELLLHNQLRLDRPGNALVAEAVSIDAPEVATPGSRVRARMIYGKTWLSPVDTDLTDIEFVIMADPGGCIPDFLATFGLRRMPLSFVRALETRAQQADYPLRPAYQALLHQLRRHDGDAKGIAEAQKQPAIDEQTQHYAQSFEKRQNLQTGPLTSISQ